MGRTSIHIKYFFFSFFVVIGLAGCKPDKLAIEIYSSDIISAGAGEVIEVPLKATFRLMGEDKKKQLPAAKAAALKYLSKDSEIQIAKGRFGKIMTVVTTVPFGSGPAVLKKYIAASPRIAFVEFQNGRISLHATKTLKTLNKELSAINMMLDIDLPAKSTTFRIVGDTKKKMKISAIAVFSEKKPYLQFSKDVKKRKSVQLEFKGSEGSVYKEIPIHFFVK